VHTNSDKTSVTLMSDHNHPADDAAISITKCRNQMKARAAQSRNKPGVIYSEAVHSLRDEARGRIPSASVVKRTPRNAKSRHHPPNPKSLSDLVVSGSWATTGGAEPRPFVVYDNGTQSSSRIIAFGSDQCLALLGQAQTWYMDGNFGISPPMFLQV